MANDLLIKINADAKNVTKAFDDVRAKTEDLEDTLKGVAAVSAVAFAALTAEIFFSVKAFEASAKASRTLANALQNQGIYTKQLITNYKDYASAVQTATGIDDDAIVSAQAAAQAYLGQTEITQELTFAIADLSETMGGDLNGAAEKIARTIGTSTNAFRKEGLAMSETATQAEKMAKVIEFVNQKAGGLAAAANQGVGGIRGMQAAFGDFQEKIGERFAPVISGVISIATKLFNTLSNSPVVADLTVAFLAAGAAVTGLVAAAAVLVPAFLAIKAALIAMGAAATIGFAPVLLIPLTIAAIVAGVVLLALNWEKAMATVSAAAKATVTLLSGLFSSLGTILSGAFTLDGSKIRQGLTQMKEAFKNAAGDAASTFKEITAEQDKEDKKQDEKKKAAAALREAKEKQHQANLRAIRQAEIELLTLQNQNASAEAISLKTKEIEILKALDSEKSNQELALFRERKAQIQALQDEQQAEDLERQQIFAQLQSEMKAEFEAQGVEVDAQLRADRIAAIEATAQTELGIERQLQEEILSKKIAARNQELLDRKKYGVTVAAINKVLNSDEVQGAKSASSELVALQQSKNATLKSIGKVAAVAQITISTAESAMNIYKGFSTIPIIGPALGIAGAAAAVAFGAERIGQVTGAARGGLMEGGVPGVDSIPVLAQQGELIAPRKNFDEVVGAVRTQREGGSNAEVVEALNRIEQKITAGQTTIIQGDVTADDSYIDALVRRISDAVEFRNAQITGVTD